MRIALITGAAGGLGLAVARRLADDGLTIALTDVDGARCAALARALPGDSHLGLAMDVTDPQTCAAAFDEVERRLGPVAVLACMAGIVSPRAEPHAMRFADIDLDEWERVMQVNVRGTFLCIREMLARRTRVPVADGRIVTIASAAGQTGPSISGPAYGASKGAVLALTKVAAREAAALDMTVNAIAPGAIATAMLQQLVPPAQRGDASRARDHIPLGRVGRPDEIADTVAWLVGTGAGYVTGATIDVNGGLLMR